jgi:type IV secretory pathway component VirB8
MLHFILKIKTTKTNDNEMIFECFKDAQVLDYFKKLLKNKMIIESINSVATENQKLKIIKFIAKLENQNKYHF